MNIQAKKEDMVAISKKKYEEMGETLEILSDPETA